MRREGTVLDQEDKQLTEIKRQHDGEREQLRAKQFRLDEELDIKLTEKIDLLNEASEATCDVW